MIYKGDALAEKKHEINLELPSVEIGNVDAVFEIKREGAAFGRLKISRGGIEWTPRWKQDKGTVEYSWKQFHERMVGGNND